MEPTIEQDAPVTRPSQVTRAVQLLTSGFVIGFIAATIRLWGHVPMLSLVLGLLLLLAFLSLCFWLIRKIAAGRNWARIVLLVLMILGTPFAIPAYIAEARVNVVPGVLSVIIVVLQVIATVLLFLKPSNRWFRKSS